MDDDTEVFIPVGGTGEEHRPQEDLKVKYKSWKKKYRKMRLQFEQRMNLSNARYKQEQEAGETARRLALQIDHLLDLLLDVNESANIPGSHRISLTLPERSDEPVQIASKISEPQSTSNGQAKNPEAVANVSDVNVETTANMPTKSLAGLMGNTPHRPFTISSSLSLAKASSGASPALIDDLEHPEPLGYLPPDRLDEHLAAIDAALGLPAAPVFSNPSFVPIPTHLSDKDLAVRNPVSVYNWLRAHEPKIFLQDGESQALSERSLSKPGALRGAGKRASIPAPSKGDAVEFVEEDGIGYDVTLGGPAGRDGKGLNSKRKRPSEDDSGYRPKGGSSRPTKKKKKEGSGESASSIKSTGSRGKVKSEAARNMDGSLMEAASDNTAPVKE